MAWIYLLLAGLMEVVWAFGLKLSEGFTRPVPGVLTVIGLVVSFVLFAKSLKRIEIGTAYAVFTGIGTAGTVLVGILFMQESADWPKLFFIALLIGGIVGLKIISGDKAEAGHEQR